MRCAFLAYKRSRPAFDVSNPYNLTTVPAMAPPGSRWWQTPDDTDLDYGYESDELDDRLAEPDRNTRRQNVQQNLRDSRDIPEAEDRGLIGNMSSWLPRQAGSLNSQLATTAVLSGAAVAGAIFGYQAYRRKEAVHDLKASIPELDEQHHAEKVRFEDCGESFR